MRISAYEAHPLSTYEAHPLLHLPTNHTGISTYPPTLPRTDNDCFSISHPSRLVHALHAHLLGYSVFLLCVFVLLFFCSHALLIFLHLCLFSVSGTGHVFIVTELACGGDLLALLLSEREVGIRMRRNRFARMLNTATAALVSGIGTRFWPH